MASLDEGTNGPRPGSRPEDRAGMERAGMPAVKARQGVTGHHVRHVLGFGLAAVIIAFAIIYIIYLA